MLQASMDPSRYPLGSAIRTYLEARAAQDEAFGLEAHPHPGVLAPTAQATAAALRGAVHERWGPKTGADPDSEALRGVSPVATNIEQLRNLPVPAALPPTGRADEEKYIYTLETKLSAYRLESDGDYHLVLGDEANKNTMIAEIPRHGDFGPDGSHFAAQIDAARAAMDTHFHLAENIDAPTNTALATPFVDSGVAVVLTGLCFFDFGHGQRGVAPNAIELHPVINIEFPGAGKSA